MDGKILANCDNVSNLETRLYEMGRGIIVFTKYSLVDFLGMRSHWGKKVRVTSTILYLHSAVVDIQGDAKTGVSENKAFLLGPTSSSPLGIGAPSWEKF